MKETYSLAEAAEYLNTSTATVEELVDTGLLSAGKIGKALVFHIDDLRAFLRAEIERQTAERREYARKIAAGEMTRDARPAVQTANGAANARYGRRGRLPDLGAAA
jgi:excisionase family DNA binding protein